MELKTFSKEKWKRFRGSQFDPIAQQFRLYFEFAWMEGLQVFKIRYPYKEYQDAICRDLGRQAGEMDKRNNLFKADPIWT